MTKIITDNSKVNINLLKENELLKKQVKKLQIEKKELEKQLSIHDVVKSLPSNKKCMLEINREIALSPKNSGVDIQSFGFGFKKGVSWCHKEITK